MKWKYKILEETLHVSKSPLTIDSHSVIALFLKNAKQNKYFEVKYSNKLLKLQ